MVRPYPKKMVQRPLVDCRALESSGRCFLMIPQMLRIQHGCNVHTQASLRAHLWFAESTNGWVGAETLMKGVMEPDRILRDETGGI